MSIWDMLFGDENVRKAMASKAYLDPGSITDPVQKEAAISAGRRMDLSNRLGKAALAIAQANSKPGAGPGTILAAFGGGFGTGGDDLQKQQYAAAQTRGALAQAKKHEAEAKSLGVNRPQTVRDQYGRVQRWNGKRYVPVPEYDQQGYAKVDLPPMPTDYRNPDNPDQTVVAPPGGGGQKFQGQPRPTYTDTTTGQVYDWINGRWVPRT